MISFDRVRPFRFGLKKTGIVLVTFLLGLGAVRDGAAQEFTPEIIRVKQGEAFLFSFNLPDQTTPPKVQFLGKTIPAYPISPDGKYGILAGIDLGQKPSRYDLILKGTSPERKVVVDVIPVEFGVQELTLPEDKVTLDDSTLRRVRKEQKEILGSMGPVTGEKLWEGSFIHPVEGEVSGRFGVKRILNGQPRSPHSGEDFKAPQGTPVQVSNTGRVVMTGDYFFSGRSIIVDHGLGCYSMYFHLHEIMVKPGDRVEKGAIIGLVGATGRATGPHLHWGIRINGARVNPLSMPDLDGVPRLSTGP